ncbi:MAG TPA: hypothetical protein DCM28_12735 [Phycisphaerales bacterium]|nr:hypothetical protein [Phycisphaerales bacterium]|tara:strand:+ start:16237 stop:19056 length:2820 start_codon:yes stop_codon:yes gene_type:complete
MPFASRFRIVAAWAIALCLLTTTLNAQQKRVTLTPQMLNNESKIGDADTLVDEQSLIIGPPAGEPVNHWRIGGQHNKSFPLHVTIDLGAQRKVSDLWLYDTNSKGDVVISAGSPGKWTQVATYDCGKYKTWAQIKIDTPTQYLRLSRMSPSANFSEIAIYEHTDEAWDAIQKKQQQLADEKRQREAARQAALEELKKRPLVDLGEPFGKAYLVDQIDCAQPAGDREFAEYPKGASQVRDILGQPTRVIDPVVGEGSYFTYRIGKNKLLQPGSTYILTVEYPEDAPRTIIVQNNGNETIRGFHTGPTVGDAFHSKYVDNLNESINTPISGKWETWKQMFHLHDRFPTYKKDHKIRKGHLVHDLNPEDGFNVTICQYSARNMPISKGLAVAKISLYAVPDFQQLKATVHLPSMSLPQRRLFWREEMADGVIGAGKKSPVEDRGVTDYLNWYRYKAKRMQFLGMNTFSKDLLEFGACQGWNPIEYGGHDWVYYNNDRKDFWENIVKVMGEHGFDVMPYYEYSGSKGKKGLGFERRARPLNRPDGRFTHIKWIESANADLTDPDTLTDFCKMLDLTVINHKDKANFAGAWLRPRSQLPISFADKTIARFNKDTKQSVTREQLIKNKTTYTQYIKWWETKRRAFLVQVRDYLRSKGVDDAMVLFTNNASEPGVSFPDWTPRVITDIPQQWDSIVNQAIHQGSNKKTIQVVTPDHVAKSQMYLNALQAPGADWGGYEVRHARPANDPYNYVDQKGVMLSYPFNRYYTVNSPDSLNAFNTQTGMAMLRHFSLNENMMFDKSDKNLLGYFIADMEKAGPYCMMAEAMAMANGNPTIIGYLSGGNYARGFPLYVRNFNLNFMALPALPSKVVSNASSDSKVIVRQIDAGKEGVYCYAVNTNMTDTQATITLPADGKVTALQTGQPLTTQGGKITVNMYPYQLISWRIQ